MPVLSVLLVLGLPAVYSKRRESAVGWPRIHTVRKWQVFRKKPTGGKMARGELRIR